MSTSKRTVYVGNLPFGTDEKTVRQVFEQIGPIKGFRMALDKTTGQPKGFGFVEYHEDEHAVAAINSLDGQEMNGRRLKVDTTENNREGEDEEDGAWGSRISMETKKEIEQALRKLTLSEVYDVVSEMKLLIQRDREHAMNLLKSKPVLAQALLTAQLMLGMAQATSSAAPAAQEPAHGFDAMAGDETSELVEQLKSLTPDQVAALGPSERAQYDEMMRLAGAL
ncbi:RNA-binding protein, putative [Hondaea fermentalgiana]|uniref:RNA-binding protein, putative n=1 Tax=Hondaea fermentalgiana TaxID=2315210 RepID=A0A2R5G848_9STRA|nr:RNA-binding protein, putative [Hondaea fermentalgiana]|eukprot:GBG27236.1 RNA-binding protein, putative [Hondaea fermentalgiana]